MRLMQKSDFWTLYDSFYIDSIWKSIHINDDEQELSIKIPSRPSEYIHSICFQFIQILLMIITQKHVPKTIINDLENEFRSATSSTLNAFFVKFLKRENAIDCI